MRLLVFQHLEVEHPGVLRRFLAADGIAWDAVRLDQGQSIPSLDGYDQLWVMGGPMDVWDVDEHPWLVPEKAAIRHWVRDLQRPFLGVCLGHQLLADALGGTCGPQRPPEVGILAVELTAAGRADPLFAGLPDRQPCLQWHSVKVAQPPEGAVVLARSDVCGCQAIRLGRHAYGLQYHVELEPETIPTWGAIPAYEAALAAVQGEGALARLEAAAAPLMDGFMASAERLYRNFMARRGPRRRRPPQPVADGLAQPLGRDRHDGDARGPAGVELAQHGKQVARGLGRVAGWAEVAHGQATRQAGPARRPGAPPRGRPRAPRGAAAGEVRSGWPAARGCAGATSSACSPSGPTSRSKAARSSPPGRSRRGAAGLRSRTLLSTPTGQGPPSRTRSTASPRSAATWAAVVGLTRPEGLALGAARGSSTASSSARATGWAGMRTATLSRPAVATRDKGAPSARGRTRVSGPGQNAAATRSARSSKRAMARAPARSATWTIRGLCAGRPLAR